MILDEETDFDNETWCYYYQPGDYRTGVYLLQCGENFEICRFNEEKYEVRYPEIGEWCYPRQLGFSKTLEELINFIKIHKFECLLEGVENEFQ